jgi:uncharacterized protein YkwD
MRKTRAFPAGFVLAVVLALQACGGGGGGGSGESGAGAAAAPPQDAGNDGGIDIGAGPDPDNGAAPDLEPEPEPQADSTAADITCGLPDFKTEALRLVNARRAAGASCRSNGNFPPAPPLRWQTQLAEAAYGHSRDMATRDYFSHTSQDGRSLSQRVSAVGYGWSALGENIAAGYGSVQAVVDGWMASDGHCANLMRSSYTEMALACARDEGSTYRLYWTQVLARPN